MTAAPEDKPTDARAHLLKHFGSSDPSEHPSRWNELWKEGNFLPWDRGFPNPAFRDILYTKVFPNHNPAGVDSEHPLCPLPIDPKTGRRRRALVPGCGKGYDVLLLAASGYDVWGLESSEHAIKAAEAYKKEGQSEPTKQELEEGKHGHKEYAIHNKDVGLGHSRFVHGDFFKDDWFSSIEDSGIEGASFAVAPKFDIIYDYTFLSALPPSLRPLWALRMSQLLSDAPDAALICIEFPTYKPPSTGGPPYGLQPTVYEHHLSRPGEELEYKEDGHILEQRDEQTKLVLPNKLGLVRIAHYQPVHTHEIGKGSDWVSIWRHPTRAERRQSEAIIIDRATPKPPPDLTVPQARPRKSISKESAPAPHSHDAPGHDRHDMGPAPHGTAPHGTAPYGQTLPEAGEATEGLEDPEAVAHRATGGLVGQAPERVTSPFQGSGGQRGFGESGLDEPGYSHPGYGQSGLGHRGFDQPGYNQTGLGQPSYGQTGINQPAGLSTYDNTLAHGAPGQGIASQGIAGAPHHTDSLQQTTGLGTSGHPVGYEQGLAGHHHTTGLDQTAPQNHDSGLGAGALGAGALSAGALGAGGQPLHHGAPGHGVEGQTAPGYPADLGTGEDTLAQGTSLQGLSGHDTAGLSGSGLGGSGLSGSGLGSSSLGTGTTQELPIRGHPGGESGAYGYESGLTSGEGAVPAGTTTAPAGTTAPGTAGTQQQHLPTGHESQSISSWAYETAARVMGSGRGTAQ